MLVQRKNYYFKQLVLALSISVVACFELAFANIYYQCPSSTSYTISADGDYCLSELKNGVVFKATSQSMLCNKDLAKGFESLTYDTKNPTITCYYYYKSNGNKKREYTLFSQTRIQAGIKTCNPTEKSKYWRLAGPMNYCMAEDKIDRCKLNCY